MKHVRLALGRSGVGGRFPPRRRRRRRRCSTSRLGSLTLSFSFSSSPCCVLSSRSCSRSTPIRFAHCFFAGCCSIGVSSSIEATLGPSAASNCYPVRFCYVQHLDCSYLPQPFPCLGLGSNWVALACATFASVMFSSWNATMSLILMAVSSSARNFDGVRVHCCCPRIVLLHEQRVSLARRSLFVRLAGRGVSLLHSSSARGMVRGWAAPRRAGSGEPCAFLSSVEIVRRYGPEPFVARVSGYFSESSCGSMPWLLSLCIIIVAQASDWVGWLAG